MSEGDRERSEISSFGLAVKCVPANHSEEMKNVEGKKIYKSTTYFSNFDNKRGRKRAGRRKLPLNSFLSLVSFFFVPLTDVI